MSGYKELPSNNKLADVKEEMEEVRLMMVENVTKTLQRDENIHTMLIKSENLEHSANIFQRTSNTLRRKMCCENVKNSVILAIIVIAIIAFLILIIVLSTKPWEK